MNRMEEYTVLLCGLEETPPALAFTAQRARTKAKRNQVGKWCGIPVVSLSGVFAAFVLLVNLSTPFALACGNIPVLKNFAAAVAFSPSLKAAVENDYVQLVGQSQTEGGITATIEYLIVDQKQINVFFTLSSETYTELTADPTFLAADGSQLASVSYGIQQPKESSDMRLTDADFMEGDVPSAIRLELGVRSLNRHDQPPASLPPEGEWEAEADPQPPRALVTFTFDLQLDPAYTDQGETVEVGRWIDLGDQRVYVDDVEIFPTHIRLNLEDDPDNTAWLKGLEFYLEDERGIRYEKISNGTTASGSTATPFMNSHRLESSYFGDAEHLTIHITGAEWLDKDRAYVPVDITRGIATGPMPEGTSIGSIQREGGQIRVTLVGAEQEGEGLYSISNWSYRDPEGGEHRFNTISSNKAFLEKRVIGGDGVSRALPENSFTEEFVLPDYTWDTVELGMCFSHRDSFTPHVEFPVK